MLHARFFPSPIRQIAAWVVALAAMLLAAAGLHAEEALPEKAQFGDANIAVSLHAEGQPVAGRNG